MTPTTGARTELWYGETESGTVLLDDEILFEGPLDEVVPYTDQRTPQGRSISGKGATITLRVSSELLRNLVVIDTPGLGSSPRDDKATLDSLYLADAALLVVSGLQPGGEDSVGRCCVVGSADALNLCWVLGQIAWKSSVKAAAIRSAGGVSSPSS